MTEDEAKTKWCPQMGIAHPKSNDGNHDKCIASDCMMWRFVTDNDSDNNGYCGLAVQAGFV